MGEPTKTNNKPECANCGTISNFLQKCSGCCQVAYCSEICQAADWKFQHKIQCQQYHNPWLQCIQSDSEPMAMYRNDKNGVEWFTGMVWYPDTMELKKLDDPSNSLEGSGHVSTNKEFLSESFHYQKTVCGIPSMLEATDGFNLVDFSSKPNDYKGMEHFAFDIRFPHGTPPPAHTRFIGDIPMIRSGDRVVVVLKSPCRGEDDQALWIKVWSLTAFGMVTGHVISKVKAKDSNVKQSDLIAFPVIKTLGVVHGYNWNK